MTIVILFSGFSSLTERPLRQRDGGLCPDAPGAIPQQKEEKRMAATRLQRTRTTGYRLPAGAIYVGRPTRWGNAFRVDKYGPEEAVRRYEAMLLGLGTETLAVFLEPLRGKDLVCWCRPSAPCHGDVLLRLANTQEG